jgi:acetyl esterase/lipase
MMIQVGSKEILLDDAVRLTSLAGAANVQTYLEIWPDMFHVWPAFAPRLTEGRQALIKGGTFIQQHLSTLAC